MVKNKENKVLTTTGYGGGVSYYLRFGTSKKSGSRYLTAVNGNDIELTTNADGANSEWKFINITDFKEKFPYTYYSVHHRGLSLSKTGNNISIPALQIHWENSYLCTGK